MQAYFDFCLMNSEDNLLDVACGTGEFTNFCARQIQSAKGIDISEGMIALAQKHTEASI